jgi:Protein of unknown function (DUF1810)
LGLADGNFSAALKAADGAGFSDSFLISSDSEMPIDLTNNGLLRFVDAQDSVYAEVCNELKAGKKASHWMWFIFPQLKGLGRSAMARHFGIESKEEALDYWQHPVLGARL